MRVAVNDNLGERRQEPRKEKLVGALYWVKRKEGKIRQKRLHMGAMSTTEKTHSHNRAKKH